MFKHIPHILITFSLFVSLSGMNNVILLVYSNLTNNECSVLLCMCDKSCSCTNKNNTSDALYKIDVIIPTAKNNNTCCPSKEYPGHQSQARVCNCNADADSESIAVLIKSFDKVVFFERSTFLESLLPLRYLPLVKLTPERYLLVTEIFHPPRVIL